MTAQYHKNIIDVFPKPASETNNANYHAEERPSPYDNCPCRRASGISVEEMLGQFADQYGNQVDVRIADYTSETTRLETINTLNAIFETSKESLRVTQETLERVISQAAPIIAVNGVIAFIKRVPSVEELAHAIREHSQEHNIASVPLAVHGRSMIMNTSMNTMNDNQTKKIVRAAYGKIAQEQEGCGCSGCGTGELQTTAFAKSLGYSDADLQHIPEEANLGLGCGNPMAVAGLKKGEVVLDLGSGAGFDSFLAAEKVGPIGKVIGVDMTPEMIERARHNAHKTGVTNVVFRLGEIEHLPVEDNSINTIISNCVINLVTDKAQAFQEMYRVLKPGGRIAISDIALLKPLPETIQKNVDAYVGCVAGALVVDEYQRIVEESGLHDVNVIIKGTSACIDPYTTDPLSKAILDGAGDIDSLKQSVVSVSVEGRK